jgi:hypothetical protein
MERESALLTSRANRSFLCLFYLLPCGAGRERRGIDPATRQAESFVNKKTFKSRRRQNKFYLSRGGGGVGGDDAHNQHVDMDIYIYLLYVECRHQRRIYIQKR